MNDELEQRIAELSPAKRAILERRLQQKKLATNGEWSIPRRPNQEESLLSFSQQRMWFLDCLEMGNPAYNRPTNIRLLGQLNVLVLEQSLNEIIRRHEVLRTNFPSVQGQPAIAIAPHFTLSLLIVDLCHLSGSEQQAKVQQLAAQEAQKSFDLAQDCLVRAILVRLRAEEHFLVLTFHHIVFDGWSMGVLLKELAVLYNAFVTGKPSPLTELSLQYADFAYWQRQRLQGEEFAVKLAYWKRQLGGELPVLELPIDRRRSPVQTFHGARHTLETSASLTTELKRLSQQEGATLFMILLAAFKVLLYRYTGQEDIIIGSPIAGRDRLEIENLIGVFINTLALRTQLTGNLTFRELLAQVRQVALDAYTHQDIPFEKLVEELQPERNLSHTPIFQVLFQLRNTPQESVEFNGVKFEEFKCDHGIAAFNLTLDIRETTAGLLCLFEYNTDLFEAATIERMADHFETLLKGIIANPKQHIGQLPILRSAERHQLLVEWNDTETEYPQDKCIHQLFEEQVEYTPDAIAIVFEGQQLTYQELNIKANQLASYLQNLGVQPEALVGICVERSIEMLVGLLGILKAGGAYVPFDPDYPAERLAFMLEDTQVPILLTQQSLVEKLPTNQAHIVRLDTDWDKINCQAKDNPTCKATADNLAYVTYTSGSTGKPKGVCTIHQGVVRLVKGIDYANLSSEETFLQLAPISFDASTFEIWGSLLNGARLAIFPPHPLSLEELGQAIRRYQVTTLWLTTGLFHLIVDNQLEDLKLLRQLLTGGDVLSVPHVQKFLKKLGNCKLINCYGPTENTTFTCCYPITEPGQLLNSIPIGHPIANTHVYILDSHLQPVPIGIRGELYIGGDGLAREYLKRPELNAEKFIPTPFNDELGAQLYKTSDLARYLPDGNIEFLGRLDHQVKIRGFRIEMGEVEAALSQHSAIRQTVVTASDNISGDKRLVAYLVISQDQAMTVDEIRRFLQQKLPNYMVPSAFVFLDALPLTTNGKIDRLALPAPEQTRQELEETFVAPRDELELQLTKIWEKILGTQPIGVRDNFFALGGHSLLAVKLFDQIAQIAKNSQTNLPLTIIYQASTVEELAKVLRHQGGTSPWYSLVPIRSGGSRPPLFGIHVLHFNDLARHLEPEQPIYGLHYGMAEPAGSVLSLPKMEELAAHYIEEMRSLQPEGPYFLMGLSFGGVVAWEMAQQLVAQDQQVALLALFDTWAEDGKKPILLPLSQRLSNLSQLRFSEFLKKAMNKITWQFRRLSFQAPPLSSQYFPHIWTPGPPTLVRRAYTPKPYSGRVHLFKAMESDLEPLEPNTNCNYTFCRIEEGWRKLVDGELEIHEVPGNHTGILEQPNVQVLAEKLKVCIDKALTEKKEQQGQ